MKRVDVELLKSESPADFVALTGWTIDTESACAAIKMDSGWFVVHIETGVLMTTVGLSKLRLALAAARSVEEEIIELREVLEVNELRFLADKMQDWWAFGFVDFLIADKKGW